MEPRTCNYCNSIFNPTSNNNMYCPAKLCARKMNAIKKRLRQKEFHNTLEPRICKRCSKSFHFHGMKKMCQECVEFLKEKPSHYRRKPKMKESKICVKCKKQEKHSTNSNAKYCLECKELVAKAKIKKYNNLRIKIDKELSKKNKENKKNNIKKEINPYFLKRNTK